MWASEKFNDGDRRWEIAEEKAVLAVLACLDLDSDELKLAKASLRATADAWHGRARLCLGLLHTVVSLPVDLQFGNEGRVVTDKEVEWMFCNPIRVRVINEAYEEVDSRDGPVGVLFKARAHGYFVVLPSKMVPKGVSNILQIPELQLSVISLADLCIAADPVCLKN
jgi:hypothetical protein